MSNTCIKEHLPNKGYEYNSLLKINQKSKCVINYFSAIIHQPCGNSYNCYKIYLYI